MPADSQPLVTVVTPVYNGEKYLVECIESVLRQTYVNWEYVIVNNCSKDRTLEIAEGYAARDPRIRVHTNTEFVDVIRNHNIAFRQVSPASRYCKVVQADDWLFPECLAAMTALAEANPRVGIVGSYTLWNDRVKCDGLPYPSTVIPGREVARLNMLREINVFLSPTVLMIRSDILRSRGSFYVEPHLHADVEACYETLRSSDFGFVHQVLSFVRRHSESMTSTAARELDTIPLANLTMLVQYGRHFLDAAEYPKVLDAFVEKHYRMLAFDFVESPGADRERVIEHHARGFREIGLAFDRGRLRQAMWRLRIKAWLRGRG
jgi:glycosyltransferase involved in cell wall biosynthesis